MIGHSGRDRNFSQVFVSHCAPDDAATAAVAPAKLTVAQLKGALKGRGLNTAGAKPALVARLEVIALMSPVSLHVLRIMVRSKNAQILELCTSQGQRCIRFPSECSTFP